MKDTTTDNGQTMEQGHERTIEERNMMRGYQRTTLRHPKLDNSRRKNRKTFSSQNHPERAVEYLMHESPFMGRPAYNA